jgi:hypothetical protein
MDAIKNADGQPGLRKTQFIQTCGVNHEECLPGSERSKNFCFPKKSSK